MRLVLLATTLLAATASLPAAAQSFGSNLVTNGNAEAGSTVGFTTTGGLEARSYTDGGGYPFAGDPGVSEGGAYFFDGGFVALSTAAQVIDLSALSTTINAGLASFDLSAYLGGYASQDDNAVFAVSFLGTGGTVLGGASIGPVTAGDRGNLTGLFLRTASGAVPVGTLSANVLLTLTRFQGSANDGYADNLSLVLTQGQPGGVPEPASWAMMIGGFGAVGSAMRRRGPRAIAHA